jgi:hypothetical protein
MTSRSHIIASVSDHILLQFEGPHNPHIDSLLSQQSFDPKKKFRRKNISMQGKMLKRIRLLPAHHSQKETRKKNKTT